MDMKRNTFGFRLRNWVAVALVGIMASSANADVLYSQPTFDGAGAAFSSLGGGAQNADSFSLGGAVNVGALRWWGSYFTSDSDDFIVRLFADNGGSPGNVIQEYSGISVTKAQAGLQDVNGADVFQYDFDLADFVLSSGTYYLSVMNETLQSEWSWSFASFKDASSLLRGADSDAWHPESDDLAFEVIGTRQNQQDVPEPESIALLAVAGIGLLITRRRIRARKI